MPATALLCVQVHTRAMQCPRCVSSPTTNHVDVEVMSVILHNTNHITHATRRALRHTATHGVSYRPSYLGGYNVALDCLTHVNDNGIVMRCPTTSHTPPAKRLVTTRHPQHHPAYVATDQQASHTANCHPATHTVPNTSPATHTMTSTHRRGNCHVRWLCRYDCYAMWHLPRRDRNTRRVKHSCRVVTVMAGATCTRLGTSPHDISDMVCSTSEL